MSKMHTWPVLAPLGLLVSLTGCALQFENAKPAQELESQSRPAGSVYLGWRVYEDRCARCHGSSATGKADAPDLLVRMRTLGPHEFADRVLLRYDWSSLSPADPHSTDRAAYVDDVVRRRKGALTMPAWQGEPRVTAHLIDLYAYLSARSEGSQGPGRPAGP
jgi:hypothetical protein